MFTFQSLLTLPQAITSSPVLSVLTPIVTGSAVSYLTGQNRIRDTYSHLRKPPGAPPPWVFGPVWLTLYGMMGYASYRATFIGMTSSLPRIVELTVSSQPLYTSQLILNYIWTPVFFRLRSPALALVDISLLIGNVAILVSNWAEIDQVSAWLMIPYLGWLGYATYLNAAVGALNSWKIGDPADSTTTRGGR